MASLSFDFFPEKGELYYKGVRSALWDRADAASHQQVLDGVIGPSSGRILKEIFREVIKGYYFLYDERNVKEANVKRVLSDLSKFGYGRFELSDRGEKITVILRDSFVTETYKNSDRKVCSPVEGILEGVFEELTSKKCSCEEVKCAALGSDVCVFEIGIQDEDMENQSHEFRKIAESTDFSNAESLDFKVNKKGLIYRGSPSIIFRRDFTSILTRRFIDLIGDSTRGVFYKVNSEAVSHAMKKRRVTVFLLKNLLPLLRDTAGNYLSKEFTERGYGKFSVEVKKSGLEVKVENCFNCEEIQSDKPVCYEIQGIVSFLGKLGFGDGTCEEVRCMATGDDFCKFVFERER